MKTRKFAFTTFSLFIILAFVGLTTCEIGLGDSVDTEPPKVGISYPASTSIVRGSLQLTGTAEDETSLKKVEIYSAKKEGGKPGALVLLGDAELDKENNTWTFNTDTLKLEDGEYELTAKAYDNSKRPPASFTRSYIVDNTPPLLILDRPSTKGDLKELLQYDAFGADIIFSGAWYDENINAGGLLHIRFYDEQNEELADYSFELNQPTVNLILAEDTDDSGVWSSLANLASSEPKKLWYSIEVFDSAYEYNNPKEDASVVKTGNAASHYYLSRDVNNNLKPEDRYPNLSEFSAVVSGRSVAGFPSTLEDALKSIKIATGFDNDNNENRGSFSFDPGNKEPVISILALPIPSDEPNPSDNKLSPLPTLDIRIEPNKDGVAIDEDTIKISLTPFDDKGKLVNNKEVFENVKTGLIGTTLTVNLSLDKGEGSYQLELSAEDIQKHKVIRKYGFTINTGAPILDLVSPDRSPALTKINSTDDTFMVKVKGSDDSNRINLHITDEDNQAIRDIPLKGTAAGSSRFSFEWDVQLDAPKEGETKTFRFYLSDGDFESSKREITFLTDNTPPELISLVEPRLITEDGHVADGKSMVSNSTINVKGYASKDLEAVVFYITKDGQEPAQSLSGWVEGVRANNTIKVGEEDAREFTGTLPLSSFGHSAEDKYTLWARFADDTFDKELQNYGATTKLIDVIYDEANPVFTETESGITGTALVYKNKAVDFSGKISDGSGIASAVVKVNETEKSLVIDGASWSWTLAADTETHTKDGAYELEFIATDNVGKTTSFTRNVMIDTKAPTLDITAPTSGEGVSSNSYTIRGTVDDGEGKGVSTLEYSTNSTNGTDGTWTAITKAAAWSKTEVDFSGDRQGSRTLWVRASDGLNDADVKSVSFQYDTEDPELFETVSELEEGLVNRKDAVSFGGTASDTNELKSVTVSVNGETATAVTGTTNWSYTLPANVDHSNDGTYALVFTATDVAGRTFSVKRNVLIDTTAPTTPVFSTSKASYVTDSLAIAGIASDTGSGIETAYYRVDGNTEDPETGTLTGTDNWFATINTSGLLEGDHKVSVWTIDRAGNVSSEAVQDFTVDRANPEINSDAPASQATNKNITISGSASDSYQMGSVSVSLTKNGVSVASPNLNVTNTDDKTRTWSIAVNKDLGSGTYVYTIKATDSVGRTDSISRTVIIDVDAPTVTDLNLENNFLIRNDSYNVTGKAADNDGGTGVAKVEYKLDNGDWKLATGTDNWLVALSGLTDDLTKTFAVRATDNAGNVSVVESRTFKVDLADPDFTEKNSGIEGQSLVYKNKSVEFKGKVWDANGIESVTVKENGTEKNIDFTSAVSEPTETNWLWTLDAGTENHLKDGTYELVFTAEDTNGRTTSFTRNVMIDTKAPTVVIISPAEDEAVGSNSYTIRGTVDDGAGKGVSTLEYSTNSTNGTDGTWTAITKAAAWSKEGVDFSDGGQGEKTLWVRASDGLNDAVVESVFQYDTEDPSLSETTSTLGEALVNRKTAVTFGGTASDTNKLASLKLNGFGASEITIAVNEENKWTWTLPANVNHSNDGTYALVFTATDVAGRTTSIKRNVLIDTTPPTTPTFSTSEASYVTDSLAIAGTSSDDAGSGIATAYYRVNGNKGDAATATLTGTDNWFSTINISGLAEGDHKVSVWTVDRAGNKSDEKEQSFTIDRANPEITTDAPASQATNKDITISGSASDSYKMGSVSASYTISGDSTEVETQTETSLDEKSSTWSIAIDAGTLGSGTYVYTIKATDSVGRTASISRTVIIDVDAPTVAISNLNEDGSSLIQNNSFNVTGTASDVGLSGLKTVEYSVDGGTWNPVTGTDSWLVVLSGLTDGLTKTFAIRATDNAGNESVAVSRSYKVDLANPTFTETTSTIPGTALVYRNADVAFGGVVSDGNDIKTAIVKVNGVAKDLILNGTSWSWTLEADTETHTKDGSYELEFIATDNVDKITSFTRNVMIDTKAPTLDITAPTSGEGVSSNSYTIRGTVDDGTGKGVSTLEYSLDNTNWTAITKAAAWSATGVNFSGVNQGSRTLWVRASDGLNDAVVKTVSFHYDTENPVLSETTSTLGEAQVNRNTAVSFGGTASDSNALASVTVSVNGGAAVDVIGTANWSYELPANDGTYALVFTATDVAGKTASVKRNVLIDTTKPILSEITTLTGSWHKNATISVSGKAYDTDGSGLAKVEYQTRPDGTADWSAPQNFALNGNNFSGMVKFSDGAANQIRIRATDLAGNESEYSSQIGIQVDTIAPSFDITSPTSIPLSNGSGSLSISIEANDEHSGANKVYAKVGSSVWGTNITQYPEYETTIVSGTASLTISDLSKLATGNQRIYLRVDDKAGHFSAVTSQTILIDKKPPTVNFSEPVNNASVNKTIRLTGTANDENGLGSAGVVQRETSPGVWETVSGPSFSLTGTNWTVSEFDTEDFDDNTTIKIRVGIQDVAGNMDYAERSLSINQDGDRPVVRLTNVRPDGTTTLLNSSIVSGILLDDDGTVPRSGFAISETGGENESEWTVASADALAANATKALFYDVDTRSFQYAPSSGDGEKTLYFRITDAAGTTFTTPASYSSEQLSYPKAQYSTDVSTATGKAVVFKVDTNPPDIHGDIHFDITDPYTFDGDGALGDDYRLLNNSLFGGTKAQFALRIRAKDAVGIGNVNLTIGSNEITTTSGTPDAEGWTIFTTSPIDVSDWPTGSYTVKLDVTDNSGQKSTSTREILVDNAAPTVEIISHNMNEQVTGDLILRGTAQDVGSAGLAKVEYRVGNDEDWKSVEGSFAWNIDFTKAKSNVITTTGSYANTDHATETPAGSNIWRLPIEIRVTDKAGNQATHTHSLDIDPDGDKPIVEVMYPGNNTTLGGTVRIFGSATDNVRVDKVWMMIDVNDDGDYDKEDADYLSSKGYTVVQGPDHAYQFAVEGTASWNKSINGGDEFNPEGDSDPANPIRFKVRAQDNNGTYGNWSEERRVLFDHNVPQIGSANPLKLVQYNGPNGTGDIIAERDYIANMYIRGQWYLTGSVWDESGIKAISVTGSASATLGGSNTGWFVEDGTVGVYKNYQLKIPVGKSLTNETAGQLNYTIKVDDASEPSSSATANIYISYDNKAPVAAKIEHGEQEISTTNLITNSNRGFSMNSTVTEADSGFERLAFFFVRRGDVDRVYNPMYGTGNRTNISALTWDTGDIPRLVVSGLTRNGEDSLQSASLENNENIRVGGLVRIAGVDRIIQSVDYGTGTVTFSPAVSQDHKTAEFAYAQIVNNMLVETGNWEGNVLKTISNDDGDGMIEAVERSGGSYHWTATIDSKNIPDGPIELHYVAYDKAGNSVAGSVTSFVSNNRPRLAKVSLGTDLSGDGQFTSNEIVKYYEATTGEEESLVNLTSQDFIVKAKLAVIPEFVGGNGDLRYTWTTNGNAGDAWTGGSMPNEALDGAVANFTSITIDGSGSHPAIVIEPSELTTMDDKLKLFSFGIWDETEETTQGTDSQWALLNAPMLVDVVDGVAPKVVINPFYWKSATDNSLYENSKTNGHIELEADLPNPPFSGSSGLFDRDPKVSGQISIRGTAYDDVRLSALYVHFGDGTDSRFDFGTTETKTVDGRIYSRVATFNSSSGSWDAIDRWAVNGWKFSIIDTPENALDDSVYLDQRGHLIKWQLDIDTSRITSVARLDQLLRIVAEDANPNASSEATSGIDTRDDVTTNNVPSYQMDVVPYIRTIGSGLSKLKKNNPSVYNRTALGRYPVSEDETITVSGFNLGGDQSVLMDGYSSGPFTHTVNGVTTLNNLNSNTAEYNQLPNGDNNPHLTDDVILDVWQFNSTAVHSVDGRINEPVMKINPYNGIAGFAFANGVDSFSMANGTTNSYTHWQRNYADYGEVAFGFDVQGRSHGIVIGFDTEPNSGYTGRMNYITSRWGVPLNDARDNFRWNNKLRMESCGLPVGAQLQGEAVTQRIIDTTRFQSTSLAVASSDARTNPTLYLAYYDSLQEQIRFRWGTNNVTSRDNVTTADTGFGQFYDVDTASNRNSTGGSAYDQHIIFEPDAQYYSLIAGAENNLSNPTGNKAGEYVAIDVITGADPTADIVTVVWYDGADLWYTYRSGDKSFDANASSTGNAYWSAPLRIFEEAGLDCAISVDANGGVHIAAYDRVEGALRYAYLSSHNVGQDDVQTCIVDDYNIVGNKISITTVLDGSNNAIPYISYYAPSAQKPKLAYLVDPSGDKAPDGVNENTEFTGAWEISTIPTGSNVSEDRINVDLWRGANNRATNSTTGSSSSNATTGTVYGNGTSNPLAAYVINEGRRGYIETAQKK